MTREKKMKRIAFIGTGVLRVAKGRVGMTVIFR